MPWKSGIVPKIPCPKCGQPMYRRGKLCRTCYVTKTPPRVCVDCGTTISRGSLERCRACWMTQHIAKDNRPTCMDCGKPISWEAGTAANRTQTKRCWDCEMARRRALPRRLCSVPGCEETHRAHGLCAAHHNGQRQMDNKPWRGRTLVAHLPCALCGYHRMRSHAHRLDPSRAYTADNIVPLCARCHEEVHRGLATLEPHMLPSLLPV